MSCPNYRSVKKGTFFGNEVVWAYKKIDFRLVLKWNWVELKDKAASPDVKSIQGRLTVFDTVNIKTAKGEGNFLCRAIQAQNKGGSL